MDEIASLVSFVSVVRQGGVRGSVEDSAYEGFAPLLGAFSPVLLQMVLTRAVDGFVVYLGGLLGLIFTTRPETLKSGQQVPVREVLEHATIEELVAFLAARRVETLSHEGLSEVVDDVQKTIRFTLFHPPDLEEARRILEALNLIVHNRAVINRTYLRRVPGGGTLGEELDVGAEFVIESLAFLVENCVGIDSRAIEHFDLARGLVAPPPASVDEALRLRRWPAIPVSVADPERIEPQA